MSLPAQGCLFHSVGNHVATLVGMSSTLACTKHMGLRVCVPLFCARHVSGPSLRNMATGSLTGASEAPIAGCCETCSAPSCCATAAAAGG